MGGGTPSLFSGASIKRIINFLQQYVTFEANIEITLEANPGTTDQARFNDFREAGINRLSLGIQSLQDDKLKQLGRIHHSSHALDAIKHAKAAGFKQINIDLMYGLPQQSIEDALYDLETALANQPTHLSWYQLTIEPNTLFYKQRPSLPNDDMTWEMQLAGQTLLKNKTYQQYEVSAYALSQQACQHNLNYWQFGDYLGIGAGAHSKLTQQQPAKIDRFAQIKHPKDYLDHNKRRFHPIATLTEADLIFEFMLNALRLTDGFSANLFKERTGLSLDKIQHHIAKATQQGLLSFDEGLMCPTTIGKQYLNNLISLFLP